MLLFFKIVVLVVFCGCCFLIWVGVIILKDESYGGVVNGNVVAADADGGKSVKKDGLDKQVKKEMMLDESVVCGCAVHEPSSGLLIFLGPKVEETAVLRNSFALGQKKYIPNQFWLFSNCPTR